MPVHSVSRGLDVPIAGPPAQVIHDSRAVTEVAVLPADSRGVRPRLLVQVGDSVEAGQAIYQDRRNESLRVVSPVAGRVTAVHRGARRVVQSVVVAMAPPSTVAASATSNTTSNATSRFASWSPQVVGNRAALRTLLLESGLWTAFRTRPFSEVPAPDAEPHALFVTAMDTSPLAPNIDVIIAARADDFNRGVEALVALTDAPVYLCRAKGSRSGDGAKGARVAEFAGKHPSGTVGYHIHTLAPASRVHVSWHLGAQDVIRIGALLRTGAYDASHVVALGGPLVREPRLLRTVVGANVSQLVKGELLRGERNGHEVPPRVISGSVLTGRTVADEITGFLGRFEQQVSVVPEVQEGDFAAWMLPVSRSYSFLPAFIPLWKGKVERAFDTRLHGGRRAMVPIGVYERVLPMDLMATHLLRALAVGDTELSEQLGALELDEEDLALCTFVCPSKYEHGAALRRVLDLIAAER